MPITEPCPACKGKGWILANLENSGKLEIQRCDACEMFENDEKAKEAFILESETQSQKTN